jgi:hypothetical protein
MFSLTLMSKGEKRSDLDATVVLACVAGKSVLVIDGKNIRWSRRKRMLERRSE